MDLTQETDPLQKCQKGTASDQKSQQGLGEVGSSSPATCLSVSQLRTGQRLVPKLGDKGLEELCHEGKKVGLRIREASP